MCSVMFPVTLFFAVAWGGRESTATREVGSRWHSFGPFLLN